ncbi:PREDICTED: DNA-binding protein HEXBP-like [Nicotiana attenuata]|uniref:DNA-binding protein HEXBP-like n=1 Tax=Nicotiana attenuata TaxID=49451 RepID=UPI000904E573|nr:PREDICTED: DNA-binding protein HEXBP-like [Nicotiana attenuata]
MAIIRASSSTAQPSESPAAAPVAEPQGQSQFPQLQHSRGCYECGEHGHLRRACPRLRGAQLQQSRSCHACGDPRHIVRFCPRASSNIQHHGSHTRIQAPEVPQPAQPARGGFSSSRSRDEARDRVKAFVGAVQIVLRVREVGGAIV